MISSTAARAGVGLASLIAVTLLAGCGGGSGGTTPDASPSGSNAAPATSAGGASGSGDCDSVSRDELTRYALTAQLIPQVQDKQGLEAVRSQVLATYDPDAFAAFLAKLQFLRGMPGPLGDPAAGLDYYASANDALRALLDNPSPSDADFAAYRAVVGDVASSLKQQASINAALVEACPEFD